MRLVKNNLLSSIRPSWIPKVSPSSTYNNSVAASTENARKNIFSEEKLYYHLPYLSRRQRISHLVSTTDTSPSQVVVASALNSQGSSQSNKNDIISQNDIQRVEGKSYLHCLYSAPLGVHSIEISSAHKHISTEDKTKDPSTKSYFLSLEDTVPFQVTSPQLTTLMDSYLLLYLPSSRNVIVFDSKGGDCIVAQIPSDDDVLNGPKKSKSNEVYGRGARYGGLFPAFDMFQYTSSLSPGKKPSKLNMYDEISSQGVIVFASENSKCVHILETNSIEKLSNNLPVIEISSLVLPIPVSRIDIESPNKWLIRSPISKGKRNDESYHWLERDVTDKNLFNITEIKREHVSVEEAISDIKGMNQDQIDLVKSAMDVHYEQSKLLPGMLSSNPRAIAQRLVKCSTNPNALDILTYPFPKSIDGRMMTNEFFSLSLPSKNWVVNVPKYGVGPMQVIDWDHGVRFIDPIHRLQHDPSKNENQEVWSGLAPIASTGDIATLQTHMHEAVIRVWQLDKAQLEREKQKWETMWGMSESKYLKKVKSAQRGEERESLKPPAISDPKHGIEDNLEHHGGNRFAGGTGGSNTAGLGGRGGPYRLDKGFTVHQVSETLKQEVDEETKKRANKMAQEALEARLSEIDMSMTEHLQYKTIVQSVATEIQQLRSILEAAETKETERTWLRNQTYGELDDSKIVDGITGEKSIFKRRGQEEPLGLFPLSPKRMRFVLDVSGSMYRFNGQDGRLDRMLELAALIMESFEGFEHKFHYTIVGHSGESEEIMLVETPPENEKQKWKVLATMSAHSQFCLSGDHTLEATSAAIERVVEEDENADERFVFVISDANLRRYGIAPSELRNRLLADDRVKTCCLFIASFGEEAERLKIEIGEGLCDVCLTVSSLPGAVGKRVRGEVGV